MKAMFAGFAAMIVLGVGAWYALDYMGFSSAERFSSPSVRLE